MRHERLQDICEQVVDDVESVLGCALVDLTTGLPLAMDVRPGSLLSATAMELMSAAGVTYFRDNLRPQAEPSEDGATGDGDFLQEIQTTTEDTYHYMSLVPGQDLELLILITDRKTSNLGLGWIAMRQALNLIEQGDGTGVAEAADAQAPVPTAPPPMAGQPPRQGLEIANPRGRGRRTIWGQR